MTLVVFDGGKVGIYRHGFNNTLGTHTNIPGVGVGTSSYRITGLVLNPFSLAL